MTRVLLLLLLVLLLVPVLAEQQPACTSNDWFAMNVYNLLMQPLVDRTTLVMSPPLGPVVTPSCATAAAAADPSCDALGVANGLDVIVVAVRVVFGWQLPSWNSYCVFAACPSLGTVSSVSAANRQTCRLATRTMRCAWDHWHWAAGWILLFCTLAMGLLTYLVLNICAACAMHKHRINA
jgi:hypothetical protein